MSDPLSATAGGDRIAIVTRTESVPFSAAGHGEPPRAIPATTEVEAILAIYQALDAHRVIAPIHMGLAPAEMNRQRTIVGDVSYADDDAFVLFTSGSTGTPRGIIHTRDSILAAARASETHLPWQDGDRWLLCLPLAHAGGLSIVVRCLVARVPVVLHQDSFDATAIRALIADQHVTIASLVPTQLAVLLDDPAWRPPAHLRTVLLGGAGAPPALVDAALARGVPVHQTYGLTETFGQVATALVPGGPLVPLPGVELHGSPLRIRGPMLARAYLDGTPIAPEFTTADLAEAGDRLRILGRADDVVISGGENIHPAQVETVLAATPGVRAACAFGIPDERWGQVVAAALVTDPSFDRTAATAHWRDALPAFGRPRRLALVDALPLLPNGKVDRRAAAQLPTEPAE
ncbi:MAG: AMP-binding protein [Deltaproteobacteria bacterium]|nr:AMP-binding protein [Deltaproteobacteria bacterium]